MISRTVTAIFLAVNLTNSLTVNLRWGRGVGGERGWEGGWGSNANHPFFNDPYILVLFPTARYCNY